MSTYKTKFHKDQTVTIWNVYTQQWERTANPSDRVYASLNRDERADVEHHCAGTSRFAAVDESAIWGQGRTASGATRDAKGYGSGYTTLDVIEITSALSAAVERDAEVSRWDLGGGVFGTREEWEAANA